MKRVAIDSARECLDELIDLILKDGIAIEIERDDQVVACLSPVGRSGHGTVAELLSSLPDLGDDAEAFANDLEAVRRSIPPERPSW